MRTVPRKCTHRFNISAGLAGIAALSLTACNVTQRMQMAQPVYPCISDKGTVVSEDYLVRVRGAEWSQRVTRIGMGQLDPQMRAQMGEAAYARPKATFLLIDLEVENISKNPIVWESVYSADSMNYQLVSKDGITYHYDPGLGDIHKLRTTILNPGLSETARVVFDVPKGNYDFKINRSAYTGTTGYTRWFQTGAVFQCSLQLL